MELCLGKCRHLDARDKDYKVHYHILLQLHFMEDYLNMVDYHFKLAACRVLLELTTECLVERRHSMDWECLDALVVVRRICILGLCRYYILDFSNKLP